MHLAPNTIVKFSSDNKVFVDVFNLGYCHARTKLNSDLYRYIFRLIRDKAIQFSVYWMPSHLDDAEQKERNLPTPEWVSRHHISGNSHADRLANSACQSHDLLIEDAKPIIDAVTLCNRVQRRLAAIVCSLPHRTSVSHVPSKPPLTFRPPVSFLMQRSLHVFSDPTSTQLSCVICLCKHSILSPGIRDFLASSCSPCIVSPSSRVSGPISINGRCTHVTHNLAVCNSEYYCIVCGCFARDRVLKLTQCCRDPLRITPHGALTLSNVQRGLRPSPIFCLFHSRGALLEHLLLLLIEYLVCTKLP